jgi:hypothetical protein
MNAQSKYVLRSIEHPPSKPLLTVTCWGGLRLEEKTLVKSLTRCHRAEVQLCCNDPWEEGLQRPSAKTQINMQTRLCMLRGGTRARTHTVLCSKPQHVSHIYRSFTRNFSMSNNSTTIMATHGSRSKLCGTQPHPKTPPAVSLSTSAIPQRSHNSELDSLTRIQRLVT